LGRLPTRQVVTGTSLTPHASWKPSPPGPSHGCPRRPCPRRALSMGPRRSPTVNSGHTEVPDLRHRQMAGSPTVLPKLAVSAPGPRWGRARAVNKDQPRSPMTRQTCRSDAVWGRGSPTVPGMACKRSVFRRGARSASATGTGPEPAVRRATTDYQVGYQRCGHVGRPGRGPAVTCGDRYGGCCWAGPPW
jgi:hypothetical protein